MYVRSLMMSLLLAFAAASSAPAAPDRHGTRSEAVAMVHRVQRMFAEKGAQATFEAIDDPKAAEFHDRDLYVFAYTLDGTCVAHGVRPALIGMNLMAIKDADGNHLIREIVQITERKGSGWVDYKWPDPVTDRIENKSSYVERMGKYVIGVGVYRPG